MTKLVSGRRRQKFKDPYETGAGSMILLVAAGRLRYWQTLENIAIAVLFVAIP